MSSTGKVDAASLHQAGVAAVKQGRLAEGRAMLVKAAEIQPKSLQFQADLAQVHLMAGDEVAAIRTCENCLRIDPKFVPARLNLGILLMRADRIDEAGDCFEKVVGANPNVVDAYGGLGVVRQRQKRLKEAANAFEKAAALAPRDPELRSNLGGVLHELGESEKAADCFRQAIEIAPKHAALHTHLGVVLHEVEGAAAGLPHFDEALRLAPGDARTLAIKGSALIALDRREEAAQIFDHDALIATKQFTEAPGYEDMAAFNRALAELATHHPTLISEPLGRTTRGGGQTGHIFGETDGPVPVLEGMIRGAIDEYFADQTRARHPHCPVRAEPSRMDAWATVLDSGGYQDSHNHPSGVLSGVYYVQLPDDGEAGAIEFGRPARPFTPPKEPDVMVIRPQTGLLVLFPSYFWHRTIPFEGGGQRISIAFDLIVGR
ncbi:tetratricopeptide repeat protein [Rhodobacteraceae bacterium NNCM2]|nr:tetratricopeptide repeat protein [Coraliihabitans acroporae]